MLLIYRQSRDYSIDQTTDSIFREFVRYDPRLDSNYNSRPRHSRASDVLTTQHPLGDSHSTTTTGSSFDDAGHHHHQYGVGFGAPVSTQQRTLSVDSGGTSGGGVDGRNGYDGNSSRWGQVQSSHTPFRQHSIPVIRFPDEQDVSS